MVLTLAGRRIAIKANLSRVGVPCNAGSDVLAGYRPRYDAHVVDQIRKHQGIVGDDDAPTEMDEFGMGSFNPNCINPWSKDPLRPVASGGSSGGSAVAVAAGMYASALGSDTGGSVRLPASFCGVVGLKPTYGRVSRFGLLSYASSMDTPGVIAESVSEARLLLKCIEGYDDRDPTSVRCQPIPDSDHQAAIDSQQTQVDLTGLRIGIPEEFNVTELEGSIRSTWQDAASWMQAQGAQVSGVTMPHIPLSLPTYYIIAPAEASSNLARYDGVRFGSSVPIGPRVSLEEMITLNRSIGFSDEVKRRLLVGTFVLSSESYSKYFRHAQKIRRLISMDFTRAFQQVDVLLTPTSISTAPFTDELRSMSPVDAYLNDIMTVPANLAGIPAISIPSGLHPLHQLPIGLQLMSAPFEEGVMLRVASALEKWAGFQSLNPPTR